MHVRLQMSSILKFKTEMTEECSVALFSTINISVEKIRRKTLLIKKNTGPQKVNGP